MTGGGSPHSWSPRARAQACGGPSRRGSRAHTTPRGRGPCSPGRGEGIAARPAHLKGAGFCAGPAVAAIPGPVRGRGGGRRTGQPPSFPTPLPKRAPRPPRPPWRHQQGPNLTTGRGGRGRRRGQRPGQRRPQTGEETPAERPREAGPSSTGLGGGGAPGPREEAPLPAPAAEGRRRLGSPPNARAPRARTQNRGRRAPRPARGRPSRLQAPARPPARPGLRGPFAAAWSRNYFTAAVPSPPPGGGAPLTATPRADGTAAPGCASVGPAGSASVRPREARLLCPDRSQPIRRAR